MSGRLHHQDELDARISEWALAQGLDPWPLAERLQAAGIPAGPMASAADLVDDAHPRLRGFFYEATHPEVGARLYMGLPYHLRADMPYDSSPAPCLGQHNARVLGDLLGCEPALVRELDVQARRRVATYYESLAHGPAPAG
jgi:crotonobetainyl-CoA:carnitine CoA-transferase CaiB-like acyl-CoA transferase